MQNIRKDVQNGLSHKKQAACSKTGSLFVPSDHVFCFVRYMFGLKVLSGIVPEEDAIAISLTNSHVYAICRA